MAEIVFRASDVTKNYVKLNRGGLRKELVLDHLNMEIRRGEIYGFVGANGAGKTTLIRILAGFARQTGGRLEQITSEELNQKCEKCLHVKVDQAVKAEMVLRMKFHLKNLEMASDGVIRVHDMPDQLKLGEINKALVLEGVNVETMETEAGDLEKYYLSLIGGEEK